MLRQITMTLSVLATRLLHKSYPRSARPSLPWSGFLRAQLLYGSAKSLFHHHDPVEPAYAVRTEKKEKRVLRSPRPTTLKTQVQHPKQEGAAWHLSQLIRLRSKFNQSFSLHILASAVSKINKEIHQNITFILT